MGWHDWHARGFQRCAEETLRVLRNDFEVVLTVLEVFKYDPLHSWCESHRPQPFVVPSRSAAPIPSLSPLRCADMRTNHRTASEFKIKRAWVSSTTTDHPTSSRTSGLGGAPELDMVPDDILCLLQIHRRTARTTSSRSSPVQCGPKLVPT
jgi:hypothetical protein